MNTKSILETKINENGNKNSNRNSKSKSKSKNKVKLIKASKPEIDENEAWKNFNINDILDDDNQSLGKAILTNPDLLKRYGLWLEDIAHTKGKNTNWVHLDTGTRKERDLRVFKP